jgi:7,8-dihydropterin-6-yl-methyl-4-(beta-D-ribofuranosyl)aminobenzene 5'-phosphate synthase
MKFINRLFIVILLIIFSCLLSCASNRHRNIEIMTLHDEKVLNPDLARDSRGFTCMIKTNEMTVLFDLLYPRDTRVVLSNMLKMDLDPAEIDAVFITHKHNDTGLEAFLKVNPHVIVYVPDPSMSYTERIVKNHGAEYRVLDDFSTIGEGMYTTGPMDGDPVLEQSLIIETSKGLVVLCGCSHPGVINIIRRVKELFPSERIHMVMGGFHLRGSSHSVQEEILFELKNLGVKHISPTSCAGKDFREVAKQIYGKNYIENGVGLTLRL